jgi:hypothetical protein
MKKLIAVVVILMPLFLGTATGQAVSPTTNIFTRVLMVQSQYGRGSIFSIDVDNREYWITAKHVLNGTEHPRYGSVTEKSVSVKILDPARDQENWKDETPSALCVPRSNSSSEVTPRLRFGELTFAFSSPILCVCRAPFVPTTQCRKASLLR